MLWGRAASRCSLPECRQELVLDFLDTDDPSLVGEAAHIVAEQPEGPRGHSTLPLERRNTYANLILLCNVHHKQVDDQVNHFTVERLISIKADHESWVRSSLTGFSPVKQADDEQWAGYIEEWAFRSCLERWTAETSFLMAAIPEIRVEFLNKLDALREWLLSRVWPDSYPAVRMALENFRTVLDDLICQFRKHAERETRDSFLFTEQFYKIREWNVELYDRLSRQFDFHVDLIHDLTFEITRAANLVCDKVRQNLDRGFRIEQGVLLVYRSAGLMDYTYRAEYAKNELIERPYPGLKEFMDIRSSRRQCIGKGQPPDQSVQFPVQTPEQTGDDRNE
jgi:hypothetical protein